MLHQHKKRSGSWLKEPARFVFSKAAVGSSGQGVQLIRDHASKLLRQESHGLLQTEQFGRLNIPLETSKAKFN
jgi:hypothetical protein